MDCSTCVDIRVLNSEKLRLLELDSQEYIYAIHTKRLLALRKISGNLREILTSNIVYISYSVTRNYTYEKGSETVFYYCFTKV